MSPSEFDLIFDFLLAAAITLLVLFVLYVWFEVASVEQAPQQPGSTEGPIINVFGSNGARWEMSASQYLNQIRS